MIKEKLRKYLFYGGILILLIVLFVANIFYDDPPIGQYNHLDVLFCIGVILLVVSHLFKGSLDLGIKIISKYKKEASIISTIVFLDCIILNLFIVNSIFLHNFTEMLRDRKSVV